MSDEVGWEDVVDGYGRRPSIGEWDAIAMTWLPKHRTTCLLKSFKLQNDTFISVLIGYILIE